MNTVITAGALSALVLEGIKWLIRRYWLGNDFEFPVKFYAVMLPILTFIMTLPLAYLGVDGYVFPANWAEWFRQLVLTIISSLIAVAVNTTVINPTLKYKENRENK